jgi:hypothetical protein
MMVLKVSIKVFEYYIIFLFYFIIFLNFKVLNFILVIGELYLHLNFFLEGKYYVVPYGTVVTRILDMRPGKHDLHFLVGVELLPRAFVNILDENIHVGLVFLLFIIYFVFLLFIIYFVSLMYFYYSFLPVVAV